MPTIRALLKANGLGRIADVIAESVKPSVWLAAMDPSEGPTCRLGGRPNLPAVIEWPTWREQPLPFVAQFQLDAIPAMKGFKLPRRGSLLFFNEAGRDDEWDGLSVLYAEKPLSESPLRDFPEELDEAFRFPAFELGVRATGPSVPDFSDQLVEELELTEEENMKYQDVCWSWKEQPSYEGHRIGGYPNTVQRDDPKREAHLKSLGLYGFDLSDYKRRKAQKAAPGAKDWELLFQLDSEKKAGMMWYDAGRIYFLIHKDDLAERRFNLVWSVMQTS
ncbi:MAG TPA: YwqG family protein [Bryobacteraceae bacterium]|nr:YwqG family protein [Bryobacteraceae bacterium]